jgi:capsular polysaccharide biosynthesis protein
VHGEQGFITIEDAMVQESMHFGAIEHTDFRRIDEHVLGIEDFEPAAQIVRGSHLLCGFVGNRNYAHWWVDILSSFLGSPFHTLHDNSVMLLPELRTAWQRSSLRLLPEIAERAIFIGRNARIECSELIFIPALARSDLTPHPAKRRLLDAMRERVGCSDAPDRRIYINRKDATARRLINEDSVIALLEHYGFESVTLSGKSVEDQVRLFGNATHIVGAHGAGLANIVFCRPGAKLLELHMDASLVWSIRRLSALTSMAYGCLLGDVVRSANQVDGREWTVPLADLEQALHSFLGDATG